jgi:hypothetical protein
MVHRPVSSAIGAIGRVLILPAHRLLQMACAAPLTAGFGMAGLMGPGSGTSSGVFPGRLSGGDGSSGSCIGGGTSGCGLPGGFSNGGSDGAPGAGVGISGGSIGSNIFLHVPIFYQ